jgi:anti-sigma regulatory factor (Ser/Thr protein kinase)
VKELSLHVLDLLENAVAAGATRVRVTITEDHTKDQLRIFVTDDGRGMSAELLARVTDPFATTRKTRKVGLGLALLAAAAEQAGGCISVSSKPGRGTRVRVRMKLSHIDRAPLGRLADTITTAAVLHPEMDLQFRHRAPAGSYSIASRPPASRRDPALVRSRIARRVEAALRRIGSTA